ncbi:hypothetical protein [Niabella hibiscisoli]|uniref:hypothetical protein n=1 Tax=Niabella hibiscisoli TaxID=1825928 RepID=UPI001F0EA5D8|nr:hypothetical protein [Niabella hibiscisoli]MCH5715826.1 hypothetical protein [Niabella hibiscisoli]
MKNCLLISAMAICIAGCTKSGYNATPEAGAEAQHPVQPKIKIAAYASNYFGQSIKTEALANAIAIPSATHVVLEYTELSGNVKDVRWLIDGEPIGNGNKVSVSVPTLGTKKLTVNYTDAATSNNYTELLQLRPFRHVYAKITLTTPGNVCGEVKLVASKGQQTVEIDCNTGRATIENYIFLITDYSSDVFVGYIKDNIIPQLLLRLNPALCNNFSAGTYSIGGNTVTIIQ